LSATPPSPLPTFVPLPPAVVVVVEVVELEVVVVVDDSSPPPHPARATDAASIARATRAGAINRPGR
jgi:hypothetical protein